MKRRYEKIFAVVLTVCMTASISAAAFAEGNYAQEETSDGEIKTEFGQDINSSDVTAWEEDEVGVLNTTAGKTVLYEHDIDSKNVSNTEVDITQQVVCDEITQMLGENNKALTVFDDNKTGRIMTNLSTMYPKVYSEYGAVSDKTITYKMDFYVSDALVSQLTSAGADLNISPGTGNYWNDNRIDLNFGFCKSTDNKLFLGSSPSSGVEIEPNKWHRLTWVQDTAKSYAKVYVDNGINVRSVQTGGLNIRSEYMLGMRIVAKNVQIPQGAFYLDNIEISQSNGMTCEFSISDDAQIGVEDSVEITFSEPVEADIVKKYISLSDGTDSISINAVNINENTISITSPLMRDETDYTLTVLKEAASAEAVPMDTDKSVKFVTSPATTMSVVSDMADGTEVMPEEVKIGLEFSRPVELDTLKNFSGMVDEDGNTVNVSYNMLSDTKAEISALLSQEFTRYTFTIDSAMTSKDGLPLKSRLEINLKTKKKQVIPETDPYNPDRYGDDVLLSWENMKNTNKWVVENGGNVTLERDDEGEYLKLSTTNTKSDMSIFYPNSNTKWDSIETASKLLSHYNYIKFEYEIKTPSVNDIKEADALFVFTATQKSLDEGDKNGNAEPTLSTILTNSEGFNLYHSTNNQYKICNAEQCSEWIKVSGMIDTSTGTVYWVRSDGQLQPTVSMFDPMGWGTIDPWYSWGKYMFARQVRFKLRALNDNNESAIYIRNFNFSRMANNLTVDNVSFEYAEDYVDTSNITFELSDAVDIANVKENVYITDANNKKVDCNIEVTCQDTEFSLNISGLKSYTQYNLNIEGLVGKSMRKMSQPFTRKFTTRKSDGVYVDTDDARAAVETYGKRLVLADHISYNLILKNKSDANNMLGCVAVYDKRDMLIAKQIKTLNAEENQFDITDIPGGAQYLRVFVWYVNEDGTPGKLIHRPDTIYSPEVRNIGFDYGASVDNYAVKPVDIKNAIIGISGKGGNELQTYTVVLLSGSDTPLAEINDKLIGLTFADNSQGVFSGYAGFNYPTGDYTAYLITPDNAYKKNFGFISMEDLAQNFIKKLADGAIPENSILSELIKYNDGIGINFENEFVTDSEKKLLAKRLYEKRNLLTGPDDASYVARFQSNIEYVKNELTYLKELSKITYSGYIEDKLKDGLTYTGIDFTDYNKLSSQKKSEVQSAFIGILFNSGYDVKVFFDEKVKEAGKIKNPAYNNPGGSPSGGSSSSSGGYASNNPPINNATETKDVFDDLAGFEWAKNEIEYLVKRGIVAGVGDKKFKPSESVKREEFAKMLVLASGGTSNKNAPSFSDVNTEAWYAPYIFTAKTMGYINGIDDDNFGVGMEITREDMAVMIYRALQQNNVKLKEGEVSFDDFDSISDYAKEAVEKLAGAGIIKGKDNNMFDPKAKASRAEAAILIKALDSSIK